MSKCSTSNDDAVTPVRESRSRLHEILQDMENAPANEGLRYYAFTITADRSGRAIVAVDSHWLGFRDNDRRIEIREASIVTSKYVSGWSALGQEYYYVTSRYQALAFMLAGGNALVEEQVAKESFADYLVPRDVRCQGIAGFVDASNLPPAAFNRAPSAKLRMDILTRDGRRCRVCGRRPDDNVDIVLHVHHIRPWAKGGITDSNNLITLCHTCHGGLEPHFDPSLFQYLDFDDALDSIINFKSGVAAYRKLSALNRKA